MSPETPADAMSPVVHDDTPQDDDGMSAFSSPMDLQSERGDDAAAYVSPASMAEAGPKDGNNTQ
jgi:hypothetical protein